MATGPRESEHASAAPAKAAAAQDKPAPGEEGNPIVPDEPVPGILEAGQLPPGVAAETDELVDPEKPYSPENPIKRALTATDGSGEVPAP